MTQWIYRFGGGTAEGDAGMAALLGGKGANLAEMSRIGLPVPPGFTITTEVCAAFFAEHGRYPDGLAAQLDTALARLEADAGAGFGDAEDPLLVSVRSGARASMPGMMDTVLNLGLNDKTVESLATRSGDARFARDSYRRFIQMYGNVVLGVDHHLFEDLLLTRKEDRNLFLDTELSAEDLRDLVDDFKDIVANATGAPFPQDPWTQLQGAIAAVFRSWRTDRARTYRRLHDIPDSWGTAVTIQAMVFGNMGDDCATGVAFTRDPATGENCLYGEYLVNAQGEDVVAGIRTPQHLSLKGKQEQGSTLPAMEEVMPDLFNDLRGVCTRLEQHYRDMQDIEFTVQKNRLYMLQTRTGKRTGGAAIRIACDMVDEGLIDPATAVMRVDPNSLEQILHPRLDPDAPRTLLARGLPASPGAASGQVVFSADEAEIQAREGRRVILVRIETSPEDIHGMHAAEAILTARGGMTSHAAVVARGMGRPCVAGAGSLRIDYAAGQFRVGERTVAAGDWITLDGAGGAVLLGRVPTRQPEPGGDFTRIMEWADARRRLRVRANAETPDDVTAARRFGAEGIGLCRTEHMFFEGVRITAMREMILAEDESGRRAALDKILPMQRSDFVKIFSIMKGLPVTVRLLDPPLHEFLPREAADLSALAAALGVSVARMQERVRQLHESNPMLGHRGCRLLNSYPEICDMQARAIFEAALDAEHETGEPVICEVMIPLVGMRKELELLKRVVEGTARAVAKERGRMPDYCIGTMIELPRAALIAEEIAVDAEFFSFGTNDLTQTTFGISRDDAAGFMGGYEKQGIIDFDPFRSLDIAGVGRLIAMAGEGGRRARPDIKLGICGEHGGDPASIRFCEGIGLDYVSCSPYRVPVARLAAAQASIARGDGDAGGEKGEDKDGDADGATPAATSGRKREQVQARTPR